MEITKEKFDLYNEILIREEKNGIRQWMSSAIVMCSDNKLTWEEVKDITSNWEKYAEYFNHK